MKTSAPRFALAAILASLVASSSPAAESLSVLLQKAIYAEETEGNLESAIRIYEQIRADGAANRALMAQAQFRLAVCFQKQGKKEQAIGVLNELLRQFPAETALTTTAREHLGALGHAAPETVTLRKVSVVKNMWIRGVSPGGRYIAFTGDNGEVYMQEPALGKTWLLIKCNWDTGPWDFAFSPDERRVVYDLNGTALYAGNVDGSDVREIHKPKNGTIWAYGWRGTSGHLLAELEDGEKKTKSFVSIDEKSGELTRLNLAYFSGTKSLSRDGRYLAHRDGHRLDIVDLESGRRSLVVEAHVTGLHEWAHTDFALYFASDRTAKPGLWVIPVREGKAAGEPQLVKERAGEMWFQNITPDGRIYYGEASYSASIWVASANFETGELTEEPRLVTERFPGMQTLPAWSSDGQKVWLAVPGEQHRLVSVTMASGRQDEFPLWPSFSRLARHRYAVSTDGTFVVLQGSRISKPGASNSTRGIHRFDLATSKVDTLKTWASDDSPLSPHLAPDGKAFYFTRDLRDRAEKEPRRSRRSILMRREFASATEKAILETAGGRRILPGNLGFSPDGSRLAFVTSDDDLREDFVNALEIVDLRNGTRTEILRTPSREWVKSLSWSPDGRRLIYARETPAKDWSEGAHSTIWSTEIESRKSVRLKTPFPSVEEIAVHPDGRHIAFRSGSAGDWAQLWVMEGANPARHLEPKPVVSRPKVIAQNLSGPIPLGRLNGPNNSIVDPTTGLRAAVPSGWELRAATRSERGMSVDLKTREEPNVSMRILVNFDDPKNLLGKEIDAWLRTWTESRQQGRRNDSLFGPSFTIRPETVVARSVMGRPALRWNAEFSRKGELHHEYNTVIYWERGFAVVLLTAPAALAPRYRLAYESLVGSTVLNPVTRTAVPLESVCQSANAIHDADTGFRATLPAALKALGASRIHQQFEFALGPIDSPGWGYMRFIRGNPVDVPASEIDGWLREWARLHQHRIAAEDYSLRPDSFVSRTIDGRPAVVYRGDFTRDFAKWTELLALIHHPDGVATVQLQSPADASEETRAAFEELVETVRLP